jgi:hypothetical protein
MFFGHPSAHAVLPRTIRPRTILPKEKRRYFGFYRQIGAPVNMSCLAEGMRSDGKPLELLAATKRPDRGDIIFCLDSGGLIRAPSA